jgi:hypothetical protein
MMILYSALTLLVAGVLANDTDDAFSANDLALVANLFDAGTNLHDSLTGCVGYL